ncbi:MAG: hypothetical protein P1U67_00640 [Alcanivoracaceae bacterium]|nr:hypothetical protein [Alcanivoracaceae bacterium]
MRSVLAIFTLLLASTGQAQQCYYYWASDCFEIRDAASRDLVHHVLVSPEPKSFNAPSGQCDSAMNQQINIDDMGKALKRFNKVLGRIDGCKRLDSLTPRVFADSDDAFQSYNKMAAERSFKVVHPINRLPEPQ